MSYFMDVHKYITAHIICRIVEKIYQFVLLVNKNYSLMLMTQKEQSKTYDNVVMHQNNFSTIEIKSSVKIASLKDKFFIFLFVFLFLYFLCFLL